ncbi:outer membrane protein transport protein [Moraxella nasovis]|uniref:outer membrane protein transport protein n=1 Tax=Moraxella nasovis TaxID=2904121 RepID=UPI001F6041AA|nr:outer membrane protein transport protein [Moraxella nasovis]UNU73152.1 outer membrane protein transport protein [Moraxella nasovis]
MRSSFQLKLLSLAVATLGTATVANAAGLDRSGQDVSAFLQDGTYAELVYTYVDADVSGHGLNAVRKETPNPATGKPDISTTYVQGEATGDMTPSYDFFRYGVKADINDTFSVGVLYDEPFGASVLQQGSSNFVSQGGDHTINELTVAASQQLPTVQEAINAHGLLSRKAGILRSGVINGGKRIEELRQQGKLDKLPPAALKSYEDNKKEAIELLGPNLDGASGTVARLTGAINAANTAEAQKGQGTQVDIRTNNLTALLGMKFGDNKQFQIYGGPSLSRVSGNVALRGVAYSGLTGYDARIKPDTDLGWVAGASYSIPKIALKAALTYRSEIEHESSIYENVPATGKESSSKFGVKLPPSYNLDFQTGVNPTTLLSAKVRYVPWSDFEIRPPAYGAVTERVAGKPLPIVSYAKDQWSVDVSLGKRLAPKLAVSAGIGYDSGAGKMATTLGPINGYYSASLGAKYDVTKNWSVSVGGKYLKFGDATATLPTGQVAGHFKNNDGFAAGLKLAYQAK